MRLSREHHSRRSAPLRTAQGYPALVRTAEVNFICPNCGSFYEVIRGDALPDSVYAQITCQTCAGPLPTREAQFALKYFVAESQPPLASPCGLPECQPR